MKCKCCGAKLTLYYGDFVDYYYCNKCYASFDMYGRYIEWN
jgi:hypothetical protein